MNNQTIGEEAIFKIACQIPTPTGREAYLQQVCTKDSNLRGRVDVLLEAYLSQPNFLEPSHASVDCTMEMSAIDIKTGTKIGPYEIREQLAEGGMGMVYVAEQTQPVRRKVALKIIKPGLSTKEVIARFEAERQALAMMDHPNIAKVYDGGTTSFGQPYFVMELVHGRPITDYCDEHRLTTKQRIALIRDVCHAVQHAHQKAIIHRDLKPTNILVAEIDGRAIPKVIDFGVAKAISQPLTEHTVYTQYSQMIGTPRYMSPEQASMGVADVDIRSDVYSLGVILYELLTGSTPFDRDRFRKATFDEIRRMVQDEVPARPSNLMSTLRAEALSTEAARRRVDERRLKIELQGELDWIVLKTLEKDRQRRYQSASELVDDLERYMDGQVVEACPPSWAYRTRIFVRKHRIPFTMATVAVSLLLLGFVTTSWQLRRAIEAEANAESQTTLAIAEAQRAASETRTAEAVVEFLNQDLLANTNPRLAADPNTSLRQVLDQAAATLDSRFEGTPAVRAKLHQTIAASYQTLMELEPASHHYETARYLFASELGADHPKTLHCIRGLAGVRVIQSRLSEAEALTDQVLDAIKEGDPDHLHLRRRAEGLRGVILNAGGQYQQAVDLLNDLLTRNRRDFGPDHTVTLQSLSQLAAAELRLSHFDVAEQHFQELIRLNTERHGSNHPDTLAHREQLGVLRIKQGRFLEAEALFRELAGLLREVYGDKHPAVWQARHHVAVALQSQGKFDEAKPIYDEVIDARVATLGADHPKTFTSQANQATVLSELGRVEQAVQLLRDVLKRQRAVQGEGHPRVLSNQTQLADLLADSGKLDEAEDLVRRMVAAQQQALGSDHIRTMASLNTLAGVLMRAERFAEAEPVLRQLLATAAKKLGDTHPNVLATRANLGVTLGELQQFEEAESILRAVLNQREQTVGPGSQRTLLTMSCLATVLNYQKKYQEALKLSDRMIEIAVRELGDDHENTAEGRQSQAEALLGLNQNSQAAKAFYKAGQGFAKISDWKNALEALRRATEIEPDNKSYRKSLEAAEEQAATTSVSKDVERQETDANH